MTTPRPLPEPPTDATSSAKLAQLARDYPDWTFAQYAAALGVSRARAHQLWVKLGLSVRRRYAQAPYILPAPNTNGDGPRVTGTLGPRPERCPKCGERRALDVDGLDNIWRCVICAHRFWPPVPEPTEPMRDHNPTRVHQSPNHYKPPPVRAVVFHALGADWLVAYYVKDKGPRAYAMDITQASGAPIKKLSSRQLTQFNHEFLRQHGHILIDVHEAML